MSGGREYLTLPDKSVWTIGGEIGEVRVEADRTVPAGRSRLLIIQGEELIALGPEDVEPLRAALESAAKVAWPKDES